MVPVSLRRRPEKNHSWMLFVQSRLGASSGGTAHRSRPRQPATVQNVVVDLQRALNRLDDLIEEVPKPRIHRIGNGRDEESDRIIGESFVGPLVRVRLIFRPELLLNRRQSRVIGRADSISSHYLPVSAGARTLWTAGDE
jgi:hypothetical protein